MKTAMLFHAFAMCGFAAASGVEVASIQTSYTKDGYVFVRLTTKDNVTQWGQSSYNNEKTDLMSTLSDKVHDWVGPHVFKKEFKTMEDIDKFAEDVWRSNYKRTGTVLAQALAGVDTALHGLVARYQNISVCEMIARNMSGTCKTSVPVYGSNGSRSKSAADIVANAVHNQKTFNITAFKFQVMNRMGGDVDIKSGRTEELIPLARKELGADVRLMVDCNGGLEPSNMSHAKSVAALLVENNYTWLEEPFPYWEYDNSDELAAEELRPHGLGVALGEQEFRLDVFERNIHKIDFVQPDVHYVGGMARALRVARMSMAASKIFVPHSPNPCMLDLFALSMLASVPNAFDHMEFDAINTVNPPDGTDFFTQPVYKLSDGAITVPKGPGWGVELRPGLLVHATNQTSSHS